MEISGRVKMIANTQEVSNSFKKREVVITTEEKYPQHILIEFQQDKCDLLNGFQIGEQVKVSINLRGREWTNPQGEVKYFNSINGWRIDRLVAQQQPPQPNYGNQQPPAQGSFNNGNNSQGGYNQQQYNNFPPAPNFNQNDSPF